MLLQPVAEEEEGGEEGVARPKKRSTARWAQLELQAVRNACTCQVQPLQFLRVILYV